MSIFMTEHELTAIEQAKDAKYLNLYWGMVNRVKRYSEAPDCPTPLRPQSGGTMQRSI